MVINSYEVNSDAGKEFIGLLRSAGFLPYKTVTGVATYVCDYASAHVDSGVAGDTTVGLVLQGDHELHTRGFVGHLIRGNVYALNNKRRHSAVARHKKSQKLVFAAVDLNMSWEDYWYWARSAGIIY